MGDESSRSPSSGLTGALFARVAVLFTLLLFLPFPIAGTWNWPGAWANGLTMIFFFIVSRALAYRKNPELLVERGRFLDNKDVKSWDKVLSVVVGLAGYVSVVVIAALDRRFSRGAGIPSAFVLLGLVLVLLGNTLSSWAFLANRFFSGVVRIQTDRGHVVVDSGPYRIVRHPGYLGGLFADLGSPLLFGSFWALIPAACTVIALVVRTGLEDATLKAELPGYAEFARRTRYRLFPGIW